MAILRVLFITLASGCGSTYREGTGTASGIRREGTGGASGTRRVGWWALVWLGWGLAACGGCQVFTQPVSTAAPPALQWLTNLVPAPIDPIPAFDLNRLKPAQAPNLVDAGDLLEVTVWDLYEPGKAQTFPERVSATGEITLPWLGPVPARGHSTAQIEALVADGYRHGEFLLQPRILVRELEAPPVKVYVTGAVNRPGLVQLARHEATPFAALVSVGGFHKTAGTQIVVTRRNGRALPDANTPVAEPAASDDVTRAAWESEQPAAPALLLANHTEVLSVAPEFQPSGAAPAPSADEPAIAAAGTPLGPAPAESETLYDLGQEKDLQALRDLQLADGDTVTVRAAVPPVRISGAVLHPGSYPLPAGNALNLWESLQMAGGLSVSEIPVHITLTRPPSGERGAQRVSFTLEPGADLPSNAPFIQPGDSLQVEPTARAKFQRAVGGLRAR